LTADPPLESTLADEPAAPEVDPILRAIAAHRAADAARDALPDDVGVADYDAAGEVEWNAFWALFATAPTTIAGFAALFEYLGGEMDESSPGNSRMRPAIDCWSAQDERYSSEAEWLRMLVSAIRKAR
jgi:hypothetical protein